MSASLVGSEMCIRDRMWKASAAAITETPSKYVSSLRASRRNAGHGTDPVSYTHLTLPTICSV
eukprot:11814980-Alexandrium_andersonii.AAC.1